MSVNTKAVAGRRQLQFKTMNDMLADAERLAASDNTTMLGNWPLDQLLSHLTLAINGSIDGVTVVAPWYVRMAGPLIKKRILMRGMSPGFKLSKEHEATFFPASPSTQDALEKLRQAVRRLDNEKMTSKHPVFGPLGHDEWERLHLRHAELHLSFALPG